MKIKNRIIILGTLLLMVSSAQAVELKPSPLQQQFSNNIKQIAYSGEFDDLKEDDKIVPANDKAPGESGTHKKLSLGKAVLYSALLPGLGENYTGHKTKAKYFFAVEALSWIGLGAFTVYGNWREDDMIDYAAQYAHADLEGRDDFFLDMVGFYDDIDQYNSLGRVSDPDRPYLADTPENHWVWQSGASREAYRELKNSSRDSFRRADFMVGIMIVNRVVSIIDTIRDVTRSNSSVTNDEFSKDNGWGLKFSVNPLSSKNQIKLTVLTPF